MPSDDFLLERILRYLSSIGHIDNVGPNQFRASRITPLLADPMTEAMLCHGFGTCGPAIQAFPSFLAENNYQDITSNKKTAFQKGFNTELTGFQWMAQNPKQFGALQKIMTALQSSDWMEGFDILNKAARAFSSGQAEKVFLVDVGGGHGHQALQLLGRCPNLHGHIVLQDLPQAVDQLPPLDGVRAMAQDFFETQTIEGANFYYMRRVLHDWPDDLCVKILKNLGAAMDSQSYILINEVVLPNINAHWHAAMQDISMGILLGGKERSKAQWEKLVVQAGLEMAEIHTQDISSYQSIIALKL